MASNWNGSSNQNFEGHALRYICEGGAPSERSFELLYRAYSACFSEHSSETYSRSGLRDLLTSEGVNIIKAVVGVEGDSKGDFVVGFLVWRVAGPEAEILSTGVIPKWRKRNIGRGLMINFMNRLPVKVEEIYLEVRKKNQAAVTLYKRHGFEVVGNRPHYYRQSDGSLDDALIMKKSISKT